MSQTLAELITRLNELVSDPKDQKFTKASKVRALNTVLQDLISSKTQTYVRTHDVQFRDGEYIYEFPSDMIEPIGITFQDMTGQVVANSSWRGLVGNLTFSSNAPYDSEIFWQNTAQNGGKFILRDIVPANQFVVTPVYTATDEGSTVVTQATMPTSASEGDIWVDSLDNENLVYRASETYSSLTDQAELTVAAEHLAGSTDLVFKATTLGIVNIQIVITVTAGVASVATTGTGTRSDPYVHTFSLPITDNSNDTIIALAATTVGAGAVTATGSDSTDGAMQGLSATSMENAAAELWTPQYIHIIYLATYPKLFNDDDELDESVHVLIREGDCIPLMAAVKLLKMVRGDQRLLIMQSQYTKDYEDILDRVRYHKALSGPPNDLEPVD